MPKAFLWLALVSLGLASITALIHIAGFYLWHAKYATLILLLCAFTFSVFGFIIDQFGDDPPGPHRGY